MQRGLFADLHDWGRALEELEQLYAQNALDDVQSGLARLIRYRGNWRLREAALRAARGVRQPEPVLIQAILDIARDESAYTDVRILATYALGELLPRRAAFVLPDGYDAESVVAALKTQLTISDAPVLHNAQKQAIGQIERAAVPAA